MHSVFPNFDTFGVMVDCSRGAVYSVSALKRFLDIMEKLGYNMLSLYTEDTYEIEGEPYFGYLRGRYTREQLREIDAYARARGIELIPCIQTLAHLGRLRQYSVYDGLFDTGDILLAGDSRVYELIDKMFAACADTFTSRRINIGMDEAAMIGLGRYLTQHGYTDKYKILTEHLARVNEIAKKYGFTPLMWSDMYFRFATHGETYRVDEIIMTDKEKAMVPNGMELIYWDYYTLRRERYDVMFENHRILSDKLWFAGGIWTWTGFIPHNDATLRLTRPALASCAEKGIRNVFFAMWGDGGAECSIFSVLPAMFTISRLAAGETDENKIKEDFRAFTGIAYDDFMKVERPDQMKTTISNPNFCWEYIRNPSKYMLYNDPFLGKYDTTVRGGEGALYAEYAEELHPLASHPIYGYLFELSEKLCRALSYKYELGARTRRAYKAGDRDALAVLTEDYRKAEDAVRKFHESFRRAWYRDKKPQGFEIHDIRLGGLAARLAACGSRLADFLAGKITEIPELDEEPLCPDGGGAVPTPHLCSANGYSGIVSACGL